jgi:hypothetical protein
MEAMVIDDAAHTAHGYARLFRPECVSYREYIVDENWKYQSRTRM